MSTFNKESLTCFHSRLRISNSSKAVAKVNCSVSAGGSSMNDSGANFIKLTAEIVSAYVSNNTVPSVDLPALIGQVHSALSRVSTGQGDNSFEPPKPAISVKKSITPD